VIVEASSMQEQTPLADIQVFWIPHQMEAATPFRLNL